MAVDIKFEDDVNSKWLAYVTSTENDEIVIKIGINGRIVVQSVGGTMVMWEGFEEEHNPFYDDEDDDGGTDS